MHSMKNLIITTSILLSFTSVYAQKVAQFEITFRFEDARGNTDSVTVGLDKEAQCEALSLAFGDKPYNEPFDSILDVRLRKGIDHGDFTKKNIRCVDTFRDCNDDDGLLAYVGPFMLINSKYPPVTMSYDTQLLEEHLCKPKGALLMYNTELYHFIHPYEVTYLEDSWYDCLSATDSILIDFDEIPDFGIQSPVIEINDGTNKEVPYFEFVFGPDDYNFFGVDLQFCQDTVITVENHLAQSIHVFPNPVQDQLYIKGLELYYTYQACLYNAQGQLVNEQLLPDNGKIQLSNISNGQYILTLIKEDQVIFVDRIVKLN